METAGNLLLNPYTSDFDATLGLGTARHGLPEQGTLREELKAVNVSSTGHEMYRAWKVGTVSNLLHSGFPVLKQSRPRGSLSFLFLLFSSLFVVLPPSLSPSLPSSPSLPPFLSFFSCFAFSFLLSIEHTNS